MNLTSEESGRSFFFEHCRGLNSDRRLNGSMNSRLLSKTELSSTFRTELSSTRGQNSGLPLNSRLHELSSTFLLNFCLPFFVFYGRREFSGS